MEKHEQIRLFKERAEAVQTSVTDVGGWQQAFLYAIEVTKNQGGSTIAAPALGLEECSQLAELCRQAEITLLTENIRDHIGKIQTGLTLVDWGIAETATLVLDSSSEDVRIATMLSETHVAVLPRSRINLSPGPGTDLERHDPGVTRLSRLHLRGQPYGRHRTGAHHRCSWTAGISCGDPRGGRRHDQHRT